MPRDTREIRHAVRMPGTGSWATKDFKKGALVTDPDELAALAAQGKVNLKDLQERGIIEGDWKRKK